MVGKAKKWSAMLLEVPMVEQKLSGALCSVLRTIANRGKLGHSDGFPNEATAHACTSRPEDFFILLYLVASLRLAIWFGT